MDPERSAHGASWVMNRWVDTVGRPTCEACPERIQGIGARVIPHRCTSLLSEHPQRCMALNPRLIELCGGTFLGLSFEFFSCPLLSSLCDSMSEPSTACKPLLHECIINTRMFLLYYHHLYRSDEEVMSAPCRSLIGRTRAADEIPRLLWGSQEERSATPESYSVGETCYEQPTHRRDHILRVVAICGAIQPI